MPANGGSFSAGTSPDQTMTDDSPDSGFDWSGVLNNMVSSAAPIIQKVLSPPPFIQAPNGAIYSPSTGQVAYNPSAISGTVLLVVVAGVAVLVFMRK